MVSKCANPNCRTPFRYLREGALFLFDTSYSSGPRGKDMNNGPHRLENYWLCAGCCSRLTVRMIRGKIEVVPRRAATNRPLNVPAGGMKSLRGAEGQDARLVIQTENRR